jgi:23S rRNA (cytosine1962-C5)-methyltransferase
MAKAYLVHNKEFRVDSGHPWLFRSDIERVSGNPLPGNAIDVHAQDGRFLGRGFFNPNSQITIRMLTRWEEPITRAFFERRIRQAWAYRQQVADVNSCRVIFAESDFLPGLIVDKFNDILVMQTLSMGMDHMKETIVSLLQEIIAPRGIYERNDVPVRDLEGLPQQTGFLSEPFDTMVEMRENGVRFLVDVAEGQKTGFFLDQKENRAALAPLVPGKDVLDCFSHTGSFALHAAHYGAKRVTGVDISDHAVACARQNAVLNGYEDRTQFVEANAFDFLRQASVRKDSFDVVILDPPAFTKTRQAVEGAVRGYKEINLRALKLVRSGGFLVSCSCSHHVSQDLFLKTIHDAAIDAHRQVRLVEYRSQAKDHPILLASAETQYIKCAILQVF